MEKRFPLEKKNNSLFLLNLRKQIKKNFFYRILRDVKIIYEYIDWRIKVFCRKKKNPFDFDKLYWIDPDMIKYTTLNEFNPFKYDGKVIDGDWDILKKKFNDLDVYNAFYEHFILEKDWDDTEFFKNIVRDIKNRKYHWGCITIDDFVERCKNLDILFCKIKYQDYKIQADNFKKNFIGRNIIDEISVNIGRNGDILFNNGAHRLSIAKILKLEKIPVRVTVVHTRCKNHELFQ